MTDRNHLPTFAAAGIAALLVSLHFLGFGPDGPAPEKTEPTARKTERAPRHDLDEAQWEAWREKHRASIADIGRDRTSKEFQARMRTLGTTPVEVPEGDDDHGGLFVAKSALDLKNFLAEGGHYSGPLPAELRAKRDARPEDGR